MIEASSSSSPLADTPHPASHAWKSAQAADLITSCVSDGLMRRLDLQTCCSTLALMKVLRAIAQPFRLLDLPAEMRNSTYEMTLQSDTDGEDSLVLLDNRRPALCQASRQLRAEALPVFFATTKFYRRLELEQTFDASPWIADLKRLISGFEPAHVRKITSLTVKLDVFRAYWVGSGNTNSVTRDITISYAEGAGLKIRADVKGMSTQSVWSLRKHEEAAEDYRKVLDLKGGHAIVLCVCMEPRMWEYSDKLEVNHE